MKLRQLNVIAFVLGVLSTAAFAEDLAPAAAMRRIGELEWHTDYGAAYRAAVDEHKQLMIVFEDRRQPNVMEGFSREVLVQAEMTEGLRSYVLAVLPLDAQIPAMKKRPVKKMIRLIDHRAFKPLAGRAGIVVIDLVDPTDSLHGQVVSVHGFHPGQYYTLHSMKIVVGLPRATITQRALVYAVRIHPEAPQSTQGNGHPMLFKQAAVHSALMAQYGSVGHHDWGNRSSQISAAVGRSPSEVAAASYGGNEDLIDAAKQCVAMWRGSSVHWFMVSGTQALYGYDMVKAPSGQWYATGIFTP